MYHRICLKKRINSHIYIYIFVYEISNMDSETDHDVRLFQTKYQPTSNYTKIFQHIHLGMRLGN